jgi:osmotically-inducible protein OsmY
MSEKSPLKPLVFRIFIGLAATFVLGGCDLNTSRGEYPDRTPETRVRVDAIRDDATLQKKAADREYDEQMNASAFRNKQVNEKARLERDQVDITRDQATIPLVAKQNIAKARAQREREQIAATTDLKLKSSTGDQAAQIMADAASKYAEAELTAAAEIASAANHITAAEAEARQEKADIDAREGVQLSDIVLEQNEAKRKQRQRTLEIDTQTANQLDRLGKDSARRVEQARADDARSADRDREITSKIRDAIASDRTRDPVVKVETKDGIVTLSGTAPSETDHRIIVGKANKTSGVVRVDDRINSP